MWDWDLRGLGFLASFGPQRANTLQLGGVWAGGRVAVCHTEPCAQGAGLQACWESVRRPVPAEPAVNTGVY